MDKNRLIKMLRKLPKDADLKVYFKTIEGLILKGQIIDVAYLEIPEEGHRQINIIADEELIDN